MYSIIIPSIGRINYLNELLISIYSQTLFPQEIIILLDKNNYCKENAKFISSGWRMSQTPNEFTNSVEYSLFYKNLQKSKGLVYKWVPSFDKNIIKSLIYTNIDQDKKVIYIIQILPNPNIDMFNIDYLMSDLEQLSLVNKEYSKFKIDYQHLIVK